jgi:hypothetical protein
MRFSCLFSNFKLFNSYNRDLFIIYIYHLYIYIYLYILKHLFIIYLKEVNDVIKNE